MTDDNGGKTATLIFIILLYFFPRYKSSCTPNSIKTATLKCLSERK